MNHHGSIDAMHDQAEEQSTSSTKESKKKSKENLSKDTEDSTLDDNNENNNLINEKDKKKSKKDKSNTSNRQPVSFKTKYFPWIVCATSFVVQFFVLGFYKAFGPVYVKLLQEEPEGYGGSPVATSWVASLSISTSYLSTPLSFEIIRRIKFRPAMLIGATLSGLGLLVSSFADSVYILYVTFGLLFGFGSSLCYSCSLLILPRYHTTYWALAHGIALAGNGLGGMGLSPANGMLLDSVGIKKGFRIMAAVSFGVLFTCGLVYETPPEKDPAEEENEEDDEEDLESLNEEDEEKLLEEEVFYHDTIWKNKPLLIFLLSTYCLNFGYYVPYVHLVKLSLDEGVSKSQADLLPGLLSLAQSVGKVFIGKVFSYPSVNRIRAYQLSLVALCIATTFVPVLSKSYPGLLVYAIAFGFSDGCGQATNMIIIGDLAGKELLPKAYSTFLVCSASAFVVGPPIAGAVYTATGDYSIAFFMCGAMAFGSAVLLFPVTCIRDEEQFKYRAKRRKERAEAKKIREERKKMGLPEEEAPSTPKDHLSADKMKKIRQSQVSLLTRSWHSIDFKQHKSKSKESIRSRASRRNVDLNEVKVDA
ncbi:monocarboxylate transporter 2-like [Clytia hemisphaerica]|uniref:Uncharacterized protein n=1 Tax=Clytia hemisphaerica TaxID=252671 RepID=A0A7M5U124_9CNID